MIAFNVAGLLHEPPGATREIQLRDHYANLGPDVELAGPLDADLHLQRTNRGILVRDVENRRVGRVLVTAVPPAVVLDDSLTGSTPDGPAPDARPEPVPSQDAAS